MVSEAEIRRLAAAMNVDPMVIDVDYSLGWLLLGMIKTGDIDRRLWFKGGTCLRKCYFPGYRFSEDLDFTAMIYLPPVEMENWISRSIDWIDDHDGPDFRVQPIILEVVDDDYGSESYQVRIYYRGPLRWGGSPRTIKIDITRAERTILPASENPIIHPYSDQNLFVGNTLSCYCLEEIFAEKIRAIGAQRRFAISRDLYDIYNLLLHGVDVEMVRQILPGKFDAKGLSLRDVDVGKITQRRNEFKRDWERRLRYLVKAGPSFEIAWQRVLQVLVEITAKQDSPD